MVRLKFSFNSMNSEYNKFMGLMMALRNNLFQMIIACIGSLACVLPAVAQEKGNEPDTANQITRGYKPESMVIMADDPDYLKHLERVRERAARSEGETEVVDPKNTEVTKRTITLNSSGAIPEKVNDQDVFIFRDITSKEATKVLAGTDSNEQDQAQYQAIEKLKQAAQRKYQK